MARKYARKFKGFWFYWNRTEAGYMVEAREGAALVYRAEQSDEPTLDIIRAITDKIRAIRKDVARKNGKVKMKVHSDG